MNIIPIQYINTHNISMPNHLSLVGKKKGREILTTEIANYLGAELNTEIIIICPEKIVEEVGDKYSKAGLNRSAESSILVTAGELIDRFPKNSAATIIWEEPEMFDLQDKETIKSIMAYDIKYGRRFLVCANEVPKESTLCHVQTDIVPYETIERKKQKPKEWEKASHYYSTIIENKEKLIEESLSQMN